MNDLQTISVVIPAFNEERVIADCLSALASQITKKAFEVILVDNNSTDKTNKIAKKFSGKINLKIIWEKKQGRGAARWAGFKAAKGEIVLSTDADCLVPSDWVENLSEAVKSETSAITGGCSINDCGPIKNFLFKYIAFSLTMKIYGIIFRHYWLGGYNFGIYKKVYEQAGGFNPDLNAQEDVDLSFRVHKICKIKFIPEISVIYSSRRFKNNFLGGLFSYAPLFLNYLIKKEKHTVIQPDIR
jgi:glycosyltransferase involved in cell wall biosynthesis